LKVFNLEGIPAASIHFCLEFGSWANIVQQYPFLLEFVHFEALQSEIVSQKKRRFDVDYDGKVVDSKLASKFQYFRVIKNYICRECNESLTHF